MKKFIFAVLSLLLAYQTSADQFSLSPSRLAQNELSLRDRVGWQTGCAKPELSASTKAGEAMLNVFLNPDGTTKNIEIATSTGTPAENQIIKDTLQQCKFIEREIAPLEFPKYFYKELKFTWHAGNNHPLVGLKRCMRVPRYPPNALSRRLEGTVIIQVRPKNDGSFEKNLITKSVTTIFVRHTQKELDKCLNNPIVAQSIRDNFKGEEWDEFKDIYQLKK